MELFQGQRLGWQHPDVINSESALPYIAPSGSALNLNLSFDPQVNDPIYIWRFDFKMPLAFNTRWGDFLSMPTPHIAAPPIPPTPELDYHTKPFFDPSEWIGIRETTATKKSCADELF